MIEKVLAVFLADKNDYFVSSSINEIAKLYPNADVALVGIDIDAFRRKYRSRTVRKNITLPELLKYLAV